MIERILNLFPDTGYQSVFFNLSGLVEQKRLEELCDRQEWQAAPGQSWLKHRFGTNTAGDAEATLGLWCALETNLGSINRGYVFKRDAETPEVASNTAVIDDMASHLGPVNGPASRGDMASDPSIVSYVARDVSELPASTVVRLNRVFDLDEEVPDLVLKVNWLNEGGDPIDVDLIVDFGNSRTVVLALEQTPHTQGFSTICRPILFPEVGWDSADLDYDTVDFDKAIPESWFMLSDSLFRPQNMREVTRPKVEEATSRSAKIMNMIMNRGREQDVETVYLAPHMFREISPALIGPSARTALSNMTSSSGLSFLSSPKRYVWDDEPMGKNGRVSWTMRTQPWRRDKVYGREQIPLSGEFMRFMPNSSSGRDFSKWPKMDTASYERKPDHSRSDSLIWVALSILEQASRQIQTEAWRRDSHPLLRRRLRRVLLTHPAGWTEEESAAFESKWIAARDIFLLSRESDGNAPRQDIPTPSVSLDLDEAVASQLAVVYSEIGHMRDYGENWIELYGKRDGGRNTVRVMTVDIGGGTTDTSIVEYEDLQPGVGVDLTATLLFKDSSTTAGDLLVKDIIERVLLPQLGRGFELDVFQRGLYEKLFFTQAKRDGELAHWSIVTRTVLIPIIHQWLRCLGDGKLENPDTGAPFTALECGASSVQIDRLNRFAKDHGLNDPVLLPDTPLPINHELINAVIGAWFMDAADRHAKYFAGFDCDLVILTGKPSELPEIRSLLEKRLPVEPHRIITAKGYFAGDWLPFSADGRIGDAKLVTALGSSIARGVESGLIQGWRIRTAADSQHRFNNIWGRIAGKSKPFNEEDVLLGGEEDIATVKLLSNSYIGRARFLRHVNPEQVYQLVCTDGLQREVEIELQRTFSDDRTRRYNMSSEGLRLISARDVERDEEISLEQIKLKLATLSEAEAHWQDTGRFEVRWSNTAYSSFS